MVLTLFSFLLEESDSRDNTTDTSPSHNKRTGKSSLALLADGCLCPCENQREKGGGSAKREECTNVTRGFVRRVDLPEHDIADHEHGRVEHDDRATDAIAVRKLGAQDGWNDRKDIRRADEQLRFDIGLRFSYIKRDTHESHLLQDRRQEESKTITTEGSDPKHVRKEPELDVTHVLEELGLCELVGDGVSAVPLDTCDNDVSLLVTQEPGLVWEVDNDDPAEHTDGNREQALDDEDPAPTRHASDAVHVRDTPGKDGRQTSHGDG